MIVSVVVIGLFVAVEVVAVVVATIKEGALAVVLVVTVLWVGVADVKGAVDNCLFGLGTISAASWFVCLISIVTRIPAAPVAPLRVLARQSTWLRRRVVCITH